MTARLTGWSRYWRPLPECGLCERPMSREAFRRQAGYCTECRPVVVELVDDEADGRARLALIEWQALAAERGAEERRRAAERAARRRRP